MRLIYIDEAGTAAHEPVTVVAGIIVDADGQWRHLEEYLKRIRDHYLPEEDRKDFVFHATDIFSGTKYFSREKWALSTRLNILEDILLARARIGFSVSVGYSFRVDGKYPNEDGYRRVRHMSAYSFCLMGCEDHIRKFGDREEIAIVIAEDLPEMRSHLKTIHHDLTKEDSEYPAFRDLIPFRHIVDTIHFAPKAQSALLQFADAFAFAMRRHMAGYPHAARLVAAIEGPASLGTLPPKFNSAGFFLMTSQPSNVFEVSQ